MKYTQLELASVVRQYRANGYSWLDFEEDDKLSDSAKGRLGKLAREMQRRSSHQVARAYMAGMTVVVAKPKKKAKPKPLPSYDQMTTKALYALAKKLGVKGVTTKTKKADIIKKLRSE
jgi:hypothetical protein